MNSVFTSTRFFFGLLLFALWQPALAQYSYPSQENIALGEKMKRMYPEDKIYCPKENINYQFAISKAAGKNGEPTVTVTGLKEKELLGLRDNYVLEEAEFYDSFSSVAINRAYKKKGKSYTPATVEVKDLAYTSNGIFHDDNRLKVTSLIFHTLGDSFRYSSTKNFTDIRYFTSVYFSDEYPIAEKEITFEVPDWLEVDLKEVNFEGFSIQKEKVKNPNAKTTTYKYLVKNLPGIKEEENAPSASFTWPHILIIPRQFQTADRTVKIFNSIADLYNWFSFLTNQVKNQDEVLKPLVAELTKNKKTDNEKIEAIYYWVQDHIKYIAFEDGLAGYQPAPADKVYQNKYGDCKGMANLLKAMLTLAGYDARLTWIGTNSVPYDFSVHNLAVANHAICTVILKDNYYYLDGTEKFISLGDHADRIQGRQVLIEDKANYLLKNVPVHDANRNKIEKKITINSVDNSLVGKATAIYNGESKTNLLYNYSELKSELKEEFLSRFIDYGNKNLHINQLQYSDFNNRGNAISFNYQFTLDNAITRLDQEMYVDLDQEKTLSNLLLDSTRKSDFVFHEKVSRLSDIEFIIPPGYTVKHLPAPLEIKTPYLNVSLHYKQEGNKIKYIKIIQLPEGVIKKAIIPEWNASVSKLKKSYDDQLILVKN